MKLQKSKTLPKQLKNWIKKSGLKFRWSQRNLYKDVISLEGHGFYWMITQHNNLIWRSCKIENFDRWSNSTDYSLDIGNTEYLFLDRIKHLKNLKEVNS